MRWLKGDKQASVIVGDNGEGNRIDQFNCPIDLTFDSHGNLYTADSLNSRVQKFTVNRF